MIRDVSKGPFKAQRLLPGFAVAATILVLRNVSFSLDAELEEIAVDLLLPALIFAIALYAVDQ